MARSPASQGRVDASQHPHHTADFVTALRTEGITPHVAEHTEPRRGSQLDRRTARHPSYALSQRARKRIEEIFGWGKTIGGWRKSRHRGLDRHFRSYALAPVVGSPDAADDC